MSRLFRAPIRAMEIASTGLEPVQGYYRLPLG
jgi:hypothetical protein